MSAIEDIDSDHRSRSAPGVSRVWLLSLPASLLLVHPTARIPMIRGRNFENAVYVFPGLATGPFQDESATSLCPDCAEL